MRFAVRYALPMVVVIACLATHLLAMDKTSYTSRIDARIFDKKCQGTGKHTGGIVRYAFVVNKKAFEGQYHDSNCRARELGQLIDVKYVFESPNMNKPAADTEMGPLGAMIVASIAYFGLILAWHMISPPVRGR